MKAEKKVCTKCGKIKDYMYKVSGEFVCEKCIEIQQNRFEYPKLLLNVRFHNAQFTISVRNKEYYWFLYFNDSFFDKASGYKSFDSAFSDAFHTYKVLGAKK